MIRSSDQRNAAKVLPDPVGATTSAWSPSAMAAQAPSCAAVGASNDSLNHCAVAALNRVRAAPVEGALAAGGVMGSLCAEALTSTSSPATRARCEYVVKAGGLV